ncbi:MAG: flagellar export chaperone FliS [Lachnospiraceae bacterium]|nr:flagellar export chaperone FliS [Lachnospiraceae bacterium]
MAQKNPYAAYATNKIASATPAELTLMLYEGAIKFCNLAKIDMEKKEYGDSLGHVQRARNIIVELQSTLNFKYPVAKDFDNIYRYISDLMIKVNREHDMEALEEILTQLRDLRDIWKQVMKNAKMPNDNSGTAEGK